jgi:hypothetical protein
MNNGRLKSPILDYKAHACNCSAASGQFVQLECVPQNKDVWQTLMGYDVEPA